MSFRVNKANVSTGLLGLSLASALVGAGALVKQADRVAAGALAAAAALGAAGLVARPKTTEPQSLEPKTLCLPLRDGKLCKVTLVEQGTDFPSSRLKLDYGSHTVECQGSYLVQFWPEPAARVASHFRIS